jgi:hypothetical protein
MTASRLVRVTILVALLFLAATRLFAGPITPVVTIKTAADTATLIPSGSGNFIAFDPGLVNVQPNPCISNGNMTFWGAGSGQQGLYAVPFGMLVKPLKILTSPSHLSLRDSTRLRTDLQKSKQVFQEKK